MTSNFVKYVVGLTAAAIGGMGALVLSKKQVKVPAPPAVVLTPVMAKTPTPSSVDNVVLPPPIQIPDVPASPPSGIWPPLIAFSQAASGMSGVARSDGTVATDLLGNPYAFSYHTFSSNNIIRSATVYIAISRSSALQANAANNEEISRLNAEIASYAGSLTTVNGQPYSQLVSANNNVLISILDNAISYNNTA